MSYALEKWLERRVLPSLPRARQASALLMSYAATGNGAGERHRTVVWATARPHSPVERPPQKLVSPASYLPNGRIGPMCGEIGLLVIPTVGICRGM